MYIHRDCVYTSLQTWNVAFFCIRIARVTNFVGVHKCDNLCMYKNVIIGMCVNV
jgi:hypothetical protein